MLYSSPLPARANTLVDASFRRLTALSVLKRHMLPYLMSSLDNKLTLILQQSALKGYFDFE